MNIVLYNHECLKYSLIACDFIVDYDKWKEFNANICTKEITEILDNYLSDIDCTRLYSGKQLINTYSAKYFRLVNEYYYYLKKLDNYFIYNEYLDKLINIHINNIAFDIKFVEVNDKPKKKTVKTKKVKVPLYTKYESTNLITGEKQYIYENNKTGEQIISENPDMLKELNKPKKKVKEVAKIAYFVDFNLNKK